MLQSIDPERLSDTGEGSPWEGEIEFMGGWGRWGWEQKGSCWGEGGWSRSTERNAWHWAFGGRGGNPLQGKFPGIYDGDPSGDS